MIKILLKTVIILFLWNSAFAFENNFTSRDTLRNAELNTSFDNSSKYQTSIGYWNDNFIFQDLPGGNIGYGKDDYVTASFWLRIAYKKNPKYWWFIDIYHNILTNKSGNYRTDLLTLRLSVEKEISSGSFKFGSGIISSGNFGGEAIQNEYHKLFNIDSIKLEYVRKNKIGLIAFLGYKRAIFDAEHIGINWYIANSYKARVGPSNVRTGFEFNAITYHKSKIPVLHLQIRAGYIDYYSLEKFLLPLFDKGFQCGALVSCGFINKFNVATWITGNQYGQKQSCYGISCDFGWNGSRMSDLSDITFP